MEKFNIQNRKGLNIVGNIFKPDICKGLSFVLHGLGGFKEQKNLEILAKTLFENGYIVVNFDATNSRGESDGKLEDATMQNHYEDLVDVINWSKKQDWYKEPFILAGQSMGGFAVVKYAEEFPNETKGVFSHAAIYSGQDSLEALNRFNPKEIENWKKTGWRTRASMSRPGTELKLPWSHMEERLTHDLKPKADKISMPILLVVGENDTSSPPDQQQYFYNLLKNNVNKELYIIKGAPHDFREENHLKQLKEIFNNWLKNMDNIDLNKIDNLANYKNILITTSKHPDMDGYACIVAYAKILKLQNINAKPIFYGKLQKEPEYILKKYKISPIKNNIDPSKFDAIVVLDCNKFQKLEPKINTKKVVSIIDHHKNPDIKAFSNAEIIYDQVGALATRFTEFFDKNKIKLDKQTAILLYAAIISNTVNFKNTITTNRDKKAAVFLEQIIKLDRKKFVLNMFNAKSNVEGNALKQIIETDYSVIKYGNYHVLVAQLEVINTKAIIKNRLHEIVTILNELKHKHSNEFTFINIIDIEKAFDYIVALDTQTEKILGKVLNVKFVNHIAKTDRIIMRKEISAKLYDELNK